MFKVRELTDGEWGLPGKIVDIFLHINTVAMSSPTFPGVFSLKGFEPRNGELAIKLGDPQTDSQTAFFKPNAPETTLEACLTRIASEAAKSRFHPQAILFRNGGHEGELLLRTKVNVAPAEPIQLQVHGGILLVPRIEFDIGTCIKQSKIHVDRSSNYVFALAVENCVTKATFGASRREEDRTTFLEEFRKGDPVNTADVVQNGSMITVWMAGFQSFDRFAAMPPGEWTEGTNEES